MGIVGTEGVYWDGKQLFYCQTCGLQLPKFFAHDSTHNIVPLEWVKSCGNCNRTIDNEWSYCAWCGQKFGDW